MQNSKSNNHKPITLGKAYYILGKQIVLKKSSSNTKKYRKNLLVAKVIDQIGDVPAEEFWLVSGGSCTHRVKLININKNPFTWDCQKCGKVHEQKNQIKPCMNCGTYHSLG